MWSGPKYPHHVSWIWHPSNQLWCRYTNKLSCHKQIFCSYFQYLPLPCKCFSISLRKMELHPTPTPFSQLVTALGTYEPIFLICSQKLGIRSLHLTLQKNSGHAGHGVVSHYICFGISYNNLIHDIQVNSMSQISDFTQQVGCNELPIVL